MRIPWIKQYKGCADIWESFKYLCQTFLSVSEELVNITLIDSRLRYSAYQTEDTWYALSK